MARNNIVLCHAYKLALTLGQGDLGAKRGGKCIDQYTDDKQQSSQYLGPRRLGWPETAICGGVAAQWVL